MDKTKWLNTRFNNSDENFRECLIIQQKNNVYYLKITSEAKGANLDYDNQPLHKLYSPNPIQLDKEKLEQQINDWINKVNETRIKIGAGSPYDSEEVIIMSRAFIDNIIEELAKKTLLDSVIISEYRFDTIVWTVSEYLCCDIYANKEVYLNIKMNREIDSDDNESVLKRYGKIPEGLSDEEIELGDFEYILPEKINGLNVWYDGFILWSEELIKSIHSEILPLKVTAKTTKDDINNWLKGDKVHTSYLTNVEITPKELVKIKKCLQQ